MPEHKPKGETHLDLYTPYYQRCLAKQQEGRGFLGKEGGWAARARRMASVLLPVGFLSSVPACAPPPVVSPAPGLPAHTPTPVVPEVSQVDQETGCPPKTFCMTILSPRPEGEESAIPLPILAALKEVEDEIGLVEEATQIEARGSRAGQQVRFYFLKTSWEELVALPTGEKGEYVVSFYLTEINRERMAVSWQAIVGRDHREFMRMVFDSPLPPSQEGEALADYQNRLGAEIMARLANGGVARVALTNPNTGRKVVLPPPGKTVPYFAS